MDETSTLVVIVVCGAIVVAGPCVDRRCAARLVDRAGEQLRALERRGEADRGCRIYRPDDEDGRVGTGEECGVEDCLHGGEEIRGWKVPRGDAKGANVHRDQVAASGHARGQRERRMACRSLRTAQTVRDERVVEPTACRAVPVHRLRFAQHEGDRLGRRSHRIEHLPFERSIGCRRGASASRSAEASRKGWKLLLLKLQFDDRESARVDLLLEPCRWLT